MKLLAPADTSQFVIEGTEYAVDDAGCIDASPDHVAQLTILGCVDPDAISAIVPELVDAAAVGPDLSELVNANSLLERQIAVLKDQLADADARAIVAEEALATLAAASGGTTETSEEVEGHSDSSGAPVTPPVASETGIVVTSPEGFDGMEYNPLKTWLKENGVHVPANISKAAAIKAAKNRFAELAAKED